MASCTDTDSTTTDGACCMHARAFVLVGSAFDISDVVILTSVDMITTVVRTSSRCSAASATSSSR